MLSNMWECSGIEEEPCDKQRVLILEGFLAAMKKKNSPNVAQDFLPANEHLDLNHVLPFLLALSLCMKPRVTMPSGRVKYQNSCNGMST